MATLQSECCQVCVSARYWNGNIAIWMLTIWLSARYWNGNTAVWSLSGTAQCPTLEWQHCSLQGGTKGCVQHWNCNAAPCTAQENSLSYYNFSNLIFNLPLLNIVPSLLLNMQYKRLLAYCAVRLIGQFFIFITSSYCLNQKCFIYFRGHGTWRGPPNKTLLLNNPSEGINKKKKIINSATIFGYDSIKSSEYYFI